MKKKHQRNFSDDAALLAIAFIIGMHVVVFGLGLLGLYLFDKFFL